MNRRDFWNGLLGLAIVISLIVGLFAFLRWVVDKVSTLESQISVAIIAGSVTVLVAIMSHAVQVFITRQQEREAAQRAAKTALYESLVTHWFNVMNIGKQDNKQGQNVRVDSKTIQTQNQITQKVILWGSDSVITSYRRWWRMVLRAGDDTNPAELFARFEDVLFALREDLGHRNKGLDRKDLLSLFINDIDDVNLQDYPRAGDKKKRQEEE